MPVASDSGASGGAPLKGPRKPKPKPNPVVVHNTVTNSTVALGPGSVKAGSASSTGASTGGGKSGGNLGVGASGASTTKSSASSTSSSSGYDYQKAQQKRDQAARDRYVGDAQALEGQIAALRHALGAGKGPGSFRRALNQRLANVKLVRNDQMDLLRDVFRDRAASLDADETNNEVAFGDASVLNETNRARERTAALSEAMAQGAGESDVLRAQMMSLRNADANQDGINRAFADGQRSINNARVDLNADTKTGLNNVWSEANADREQLWTDYYNQTAETQIQLGNALGQQAEYFGLAIEAAANAGSGGGKPSKTKTTAKSSTKTTSQTKDREGGGGRTAVVLGGERDGGRTAVAQAGFNARPTAVLGVGGPDGGRPTASGGKGKKGTPVPRDWDKGNDLGKGKGKPGRPKGGGGLRAQRDAATAASDAALLDAAKTQGKVWDNPGNPDWLKNWEGTPQTNTRVANSVFVAGAGAGQQMKTPEGATLRKW